MIIKRKIGPKGQIIIPKDVRALLGVGPGDEISMEITGSDVKLKSSVDQAAFFREFCSLPKKLEKEINIEKLLDEEYH